jgi:hypothetical protein
LQEIKVGSLIVSLIDSDELGLPFWIAKVIQIIKDIDQNRLLSLFWDLGYTTTNVCVRWNHWGFKTRDRSVKKIVIFEFIIRYQLKKNHYNLVSRSREHVGIF